MINTSRKYIFILLFFISISENCFAWNFAGSAQSKLAIGTISTLNSTSVPETDMTIYGIEAMLGIRIYNNFIFGASAEYSIFKQRTEPSEVSNINSQGKLMALSPTIGFQFGKFRLIGKIPFLIKETYTLDKKTPADEELIYEDVHVVSLQLQYSLSAESRSFWGFDFQKISFNQVMQGSALTTLKSDQVLNIESYAIVYGYKF